jgi:YggT family protein
MHRETWRGEARRPAEVTQVLAPAPGLPPGPLPAKRKAPAGSGAAMRAILDVLMLILQLYTYVIIIVAILSWLIAFNVINVYNDFVRSIWNALNAVTEPLLKPIRNLLPAMGGLDISPVILLLLIFLVQDIIERYVYPNVF